MNVTLPPLHHGQKSIRDDDSQFRALTCGRRWGKTRLGVWLSIRELLREKRGWWVAPTYKDSQVAWREMTQLTKQVPGTDLNLSDKKITFRDGELTVRSSSKPDSLRSEGLDFLVMDEVALVEERAWNEVLMPSLMDRDGWALGLTTPRGKNWWYRWQGDKDVSSYKHPSWDNPFLPESAIKTFKRKMPEKKFKQEIEAEFMDFEGKIFPSLPENLPQAQTGPSEGNNYVAGIDWGRIDDFTVISIIEVETRRVVCVHRMQGSYDKQLYLVKRVLEKWNPVHTYAESNSMGQALIDQLVNSIEVSLEGFATTAQSKPMMIDNLCVALERNELQLMENEELRKEFETFRYKNTSSDYVRYEHQEGEHDDIVIATALAWLSYCNCSEPLEFLVA